MIKAFFNLLKRIFTRKQTAPEVPAQKKQNYLGSIRIKKGEKLFEIDRLTLDVREAQYQQYEFAGRKKLIVNPECVYIAAMNKGNALRKYRIRQNS